VTISTLVSVPPWKFVMTPPETMTASVSLPVVPVMVRVSVPIPPSIVSAPSPIV